MKILPLSKRLGKYVQRHGIGTLVMKQSTLFESNPQHPSLHTELLEPKHLCVYSFRITRKYRAMFIYRGNEMIEILDITNHYR